MHKKFIRNPTKSQNRKNEFIFFRVCFKNIKIKEAPFFRQTFSDRGTNSGENVSYYFLINPT